MNKRDGAIAAAAEAMRFRERNLPPANDQDEWWEDAAEALAAADAHDAAHGIHRVSLDDATVERVRRVLAKGACGVYLSDLPFEAQARNVVAMLTEGDQ